MAVSVLTLYIGLVLYMAIEAWPALLHMSWTDIITGTVWKPMAQSPVLGLSYIISASLYVSLLSLVWALPLGDWHLCRLESRRITAYFVNFVYPLLI